MSPVSHVVLTIFAFIREKCQYLRWFFFNDFFLYEPLQNIDPVQEAKIDGFEFLCSFG